MLVFHLRLPTKIIKYRDVSVYTPQQHVRAHPMFPFISFQPFYYVGISHFEIFVAQGTHKYRMQPA